jgi:hypothetical protein
MKRTEEQIESDAVGFRERMQFLESAWPAKVEYEVDLSTGACWFKVQPAGSSTTLVVDGVKAWNVTLPAAE